MSDEKRCLETQPAGQAAQQSGTASEAGAAQPREIGGRKQGLEPTRYGDWEKNGRCIDF